MDKICCKHYPNILIPNISSVLVAGDLYEHRPTGPLLQHTGWYKKLFEPNESSED
jgi:hypothetical protein